MAHYPKGDVKNQKDHARKEIKRKKARIFNNEEDFNG